VRLRSKYMIINNHINTLNFVLPVIHTLGKTDTIKEMIRIYDKQLKGELFKTRVGAMVERQDSDVLTWLCSIPGCSIGTAKIFREIYEDWDDMYKHKEDFENIIVGGKKLGKRGRGIKVFLEQKWHNKQIAIARRKQQKNPKRTP